MPTRFTAMVLFIVLSLFSLAFAQARGGPEVLAIRIAGSFSCISSAIFGFMLVNIPVVFTVYYFASYLNVQEKNRRQGRGSFYSDELLLLGFTSLMVAGLLRLLFSYWEWTGIPVQAIIAKYLLCNDEGELENACAGLFLPKRLTVPETCYLSGIAADPYFRTAMFFLVGFGSFVSRSFLLFLPIVVFFALLGKNMLAAYTQVKERQSGWFSVSLVAFADAIVMYLVLLLYLMVVYNLLHVPWWELTSWLKVLIGGVR